MARIAIDARKINSGTGRYVERLLTYLQKIDKVNEYLVLLKEKDVDSFRPTNPNFKPIFTPHKEFTFGEQLDYAKQIKNLNVDLVHFPMAQQPIRYGRKVVTSILDLTTARFSNPSKNKIVFLIKQKIYVFLVKLVVKKSKQIITISDYVKEDLLNFVKINKDKITTIYLAADEITDPMEPIKDLQSKPFIFYVGRPQPHKNLSRLLQAFAILKKSHLDLLLVLAGRKDEVYDGVAEEAKKVGVNESVIFLGYVTEGQLKWLYRGCKAYVFPSLSEGFGLPGLEAMRHGAPVISSDMTCLPEVYDDAAWYCNPLDVHDIARSIDEVLTNTELRNELIKRGRERARQFSWQKMAEQTLDVYEKALRT
jgi:glycosyltransferase involved in cell wall biosynthesis